MFEVIQEFLPGAVTLSMDMYMMSMLLEGNFDDPRLWDRVSVGEFKGLKNGETVQAPVYDYKESKRTGYVTVPCPASKVVILEGIYALNEKLRPMMDLKWRHGQRADLVKRVLRDINHRGQALSIIHQISETVYPMYKAFIEPDLRTAHLKVVNSFNPFAGFQDPTYILKSDPSRRESHQDGLERIVKSRTRWRRRISANFRPRWSRRHVAAPNRSMTGTTRSCSPRR